MLWPDGGLLGRGGTCLPVCPGSRLPVHVDFKVIKKAFTFTLDGNAHAQSEVK